MGSNPTLSASLRRAYGWQAESTGRLTSANKPGMTLRRLPTIGSAKVGFSPTESPATFLRTKSRRRASPIFGYSVNLPPQTRFKVRISTKVWGQPCFEGWWLGLTSRAGR